MDTRTPTAAKRPLGRRLGAAEEVRSGTRTLQETDRGPSVRAQEDEAVKGHTKPEKEEHGEGEQIQALTKEKHENFWLLGKRW